MAKATVYAYEIYDSQSDAWVRQPLKSTRQRLAVLGTTEIFRIIPGSAKEVELSDIDADGSYAPKR